MKYLYYSVPFGLAFSNNTRLNDPSRPLFWRNFGPFFFIPLLQFIVLRHLHSSFKVLSPFHLDWGVEFEKAFPKPWIFYLFWSFESLSCCVTQFLPGFWCQTDDLTFTSRILRCTEEFIVHSMTARCQGPLAANQPQIINPPAPCLTEDYL